MFLDLVSFGVAPLADTPSPVGERAVSMVTPADVMQQPDVAAPVKKVPPVQLSLNFSRRL